MRVGDSALASFLAQTRVSVTGFPVPGSAKGSPGPSGPPGVGQDLTRLSWEVVSVCVGLTCAVVIKFILTHRGFSPQSAGPIGLGPVRRQHPGCRTWWSKTAQVMTTKEQRDGKGGDRA